MFRHWLNEVERRKKGKKPRLLIAVMKCFWRKLFIQGLMLFLEVFHPVGQGGAYFYYGSKKPKRISIILFTEIL